MEWNNQAISTNESQDEITVEFDGFKEKERVPRSWLEQSETLSAMLSFGKDRPDTSIVLFSPMMPANFKLIKPLLELLALHATDQVKKAELKKIVDSYTVHECSSLLVAADYLDIPLLIEVVAPVYVAHSTTSELLSKKTIVQTLEQANSLSPLLQEALQETLFDTISSRLSFLPIKTSPVATFADGYPSANVCFSPDGAFFACGFAQGTIKIWDTNARTCVHTLVGHTSCVEDVCFSPDNKFLVSASADRTVRLWDSTSGECSAILTGHTNTVHSISFNANGNLFASSSEDGTIRLWDSQTGRCTQIIKAQPAKLFGPVCLSNDDATVASTLDNGTIKLWNSKTGACINRKDIRYIYWRPSLCFSSDGELFASSAIDGTIRLRSAKTGVCIKKLTGHKENVPSVCFSSDGKLLASGSYDHTVRVWNTKTGRCMKKLTGHTCAVRTVYFSPKDTMLASIGSDKTIKIWNSTTGMCIQTLVGHADWVFSASFSFDEKMLVSASSDGTIKIWDLDARKHAFKDLSTSQLLLLYALEHQYSTMSDIDGITSLKDVFSSLPFDHGVLRMQFDSLAYQPHVTIDGIVRSMAFIVGATACGLSALNKLVFRHQKDNG